MTKSKFETGHFRNLSLFEKMVDYLKTQPSYLPDASDITVQSLDLYFKEVQNATNTLTSSSAHLQMQINNRVQIFEQMQKLAIRLMQYLKANNFSEDAIKDVNTYYKALRSQRKSTVATVGDDGSMSEKKISNSRLSYHSKAENFQKMVETISAIPNYNPSDANIQLAKLQLFSQQLLQANSENNTAYNKVVNDRNKRDLLMYEKNTGMVDRALRVKTYMKYKFGGKSDQYHYINSLKFTKKQIRIGEQIEDLLNT